MVSQRWNDRSRITDDVDSAAGNPQSVNAVRTGAIKTLMRLTKDWLIKLYRHRNRCLFDQIFSERIIENARRNSKLMKDDPLISVARAASKVA